MTPEDYKIYTEGFEAMRADAIAACAAEAKQWDHDLPARAIANLAEALAAIPGRKQTIGGPSAGPGAAYAQWRGPKASLPLGRPPIADPAHWQAQAKLGAVMVDESRGLTASPEAMASADFVIDMSAQREALAAAERRGWERAEAEAEAVCRTARAEAEAGRDDIDPVDVADDIMSAIQNLEIEQ